MTSGPDYIQLYPTLRCDRSCGFCFNRSMPAMPDMSLDAFRVMLKRLSLRGAGTIDIMGGEPSLHGNIVAMVRHAVELGLRVNLSSNGSNTAVLAELCGMGHDVTTGISINDRETLDRLGKFIEKQKPVVKSVFAPSLDKTLIQDVLVRNPRKYYLIYRDAASQDELRETVPFPEYVKAVAQRGPRIGMVYCSGFVPDEACPELEAVRCPAGTSKLGVMPDGSVYPCNLFFGRPGFLLGNILTDPFEAIWGHPALAFFRAFSGNACLRTACGLHRRCHGGCPAQALALCGDLSAPDPRCGRFPR